VLRTNRTLIYIISIVILALSVGCAQKSTKSGSTVANQTETQTTRDGLKMIVARPGAYAERPADDTFVHNGP